MGAVLKPKDIIKKNIIIGKLHEKQVQANGIDVTLKNDCVIETKGFINCEINEQFDFKNCIGLLFIRSSFSRLGIFCTSGVYDVGFKGAAGLSLYNLGNESVALSKGTRVAQMIFIEYKSKNKYQGYYNKVKSVSSKMLRSKR